MHVLCEQALTRTSYAAFQERPSRLQVLLCQVHSQSPVPHQPPTPGDLLPVSPSSQWKHNATHQHEPTQ